jgi:hypothetical protein
VTGGLGRPALLDGGHHLQVTGGLGCESRHNLNVTSGIRLRQGVQGARGGTTTQVLGHL